MTDVELRDEMITLLLAGHETTATSLAWAFHRILGRPDVLAKLDAERARVVGDGSVEPHHVNALEYLDAVVKETARLNPVVPNVGRRLQEPMWIGGHHLPAGVVAAPCMYLTHRRPDVWPDPEHFDPERFVGARPSPYAFFPFGGGVRRCIGAAFATYEMKVVLAQVLSRVELRAAPGYRVRLIRRTVTFAPSGGVPVVVGTRAA
jgi:cytochrome P450